MFYKASSHIHNVFGYGDVFTGKFFFRGSLRLDGLLKGEVVTDANIYISPTGLGIGKLKGNLIDIRGIVEGDIFASYLVIIRSTGFVKGKVYSSFIEVEEGGILSASCLISVLDSRHKLASYLIQENKKNSFC